MLRRLPRLLVAAEEVREQNGQKVVACVDQKGGGGVDALA